MFTRFWINTLALIASCALADETQPPQQTAAIGDLNLRSGGTLVDCRIGYRMAGALNGDHSNVIVFTTWFTGKTGDLLTSGWIGPGRLADTDRYFIIAIDALANGVSSSPSNSASQPGADFPEVTIADMVDAEYILLTRHLAVEHVRAVMGISMGGMQTFQWLGQYPGFMDKAVAIDGSPRMTSWDLLEWQTHARLVETLLDAGVADQKITETVFSVFMLTLWTPGYFVKNVTPETLPEFKAGFMNAFQHVDPRDYLAQLRAMITLNVFDQRGAAEPPYPDRLKAEILVVASGSDHAVNPVPARELAESLGARYFDTGSNCGHLGTVCEAPEVTATVNAFLK